MTSQVAKLTISLPRDLILFADELASEMQVSRSKVISSCLRELADKRLREQMEEGYKAMAGENQQFAGVAMDLVSEILPEWK